jgi:hypothetical protein
MTSEELSVGRYHAFTRGRALRERRIRPLREHLGDEALSFADALDLEGDGVDGLLHALEPCFDALRLLRRSATKRRHLLFVLEPHAYDEHCGRDAKDEGDNNDLRVYHRCFYLLGLVNGWRASSKLFYASLE